MSENKDRMLGRIQKILNWVALEFITVFLWDARKALVEVRVLFESETPLFMFLVPAEIPKNF
jgi:hypothetical protein